VALTLIARRADDEQRLDRLSHAAAAGRRNGRCRSPGAARRRQPAGGRRRSELARGAQPDDPLRQRGGAAATSTSTIREHEIFGIIGPANAGKTSFLKAINRMDVFTPACGWKARSTSPAVTRAD
jgi:ATPase subunit of ABC transporter with duplicated ATPase domains